MTAANCKCFFLRNILQCFLLDKIFDTDLSKCNWIIAIKSLLEALNIPFCRKIDKINLYTSLNIKPVCRYKTIKELYAVVKLLNPFT